MDAAARIPPVFGSMATAAAFCTLFLLLRSSLYAVSCAALDTLMTTLPPGLSPVNISLMRSATWESALPFRYSFSSFSMAVAPRVTLLYPTRCA
jgi:hypothetical protein